MKKKFVRDEKNVFAVSKSFGSLLKTNIRDIH